MPQVLPGNQTNQYYILVSNLPWTCTWQRLKDFARCQDSHGNCLAIEHAQVYPDSTCGWVTVRGKEDFLKALQHLQGGMLENRALCADGRNETEPIQIRDLARSQWASQHFKDGSFTMDIIPTNTHEASITTSMTAAYHDDRGITNYQHFQSIEISPNASIPPALPGVMYAGDMAPTTPVFVAPLRSIIRAPCYSPIAIQCDAMPIVQSKIIITQIPTNTAVSELQAFICAIMKARFLDTSVENPFLALQSMKIERHPDGKQKTHAFMIFGAYNMARDVVDMLDGVKFHDRELRVKLAKEGAEPREKRRVSAPLQDQFISTSSSMLHSRERRPQPQGQVSSQDPKPPRTWSTVALASREQMAERSKERRESKKGLLEQNERERIRASAISTVAAVAAAAAKKGDFLKSPMVVNGSLPGKNS